jgi:hypothetical protein
MSRGKTGGRGGVDQREPTGISHAIQRKHVNLQFSQGLSFSIAYAPRMLSWSWGIAVEDPFPRYRSG